jgi:hypothetical protein
MKKLLYRTLAKRTRDRCASLVRPLITIGAGFVLALFSAALTYTAPPAMGGTFGDGAAAFFLQTTSTPQPKDMSEIGSTDGIVVMGILIALIVIVPILWQRKSWMEPR